jgi:hypothetical protein
MKIFSKHFCIFIIMPPKKKTAKTVGKKKLTKLKALLGDSYTQNGTLPEGITKDNSLSGKRVSVYNDSTNGKTYVAHRGTHSIKDWVTDFAMFLGYESGRRFKHASKIQNKAEKKYGSKNVVTIGHSLGGRIAEKVGKNSSEVITYNKAVTPRSIIEDVVNPISDNQNDIRTRSDIVSVGSVFQRRQNQVINLNSPTMKVISEHSVSAIQPESLKYPASSASHPTPIKNDPT